MEPHRHHGDGDGGEGFGQRAAGVGGQPRPLVCGVGAGVGVPADLWCVGGGGDGQAGGRVERPAVAGGGLEAGEEPVGQPAEAVPSA